MAAEDFDVPEGGDMFPSDGAAFTGGDDAGDMMMDGGAAPAQTDDFAGGDGMDAFGGADNGTADAFGSDADGDGYAAPDAGDAAAPPAAATNASGARADTASAINPMAEFNRKFREAGEAKDDAEQDLKNSSRAAGRSSLETWMAEKEAQLETRKGQNRTDEAAALEAMAEALTQAPWSRVVTLVDISSTSTEAASADPERMRSLLIQLKAKPPTAAATA